MKHLSFLFFLLLFNSIVAQINPLIPDWVKPIDVKSVGAVNKKQIKEGYYYALFDEQFHVPKRHNYYHYAISVLAEEALTDVSQIEFSYDPSYEKVCLHNVKIYRGTEIIDKTKSLDIKILNEESKRNKGILSGKKTFYVNLSDVRKGDVLEYSYSIIGENPIMANYFNFNISLSYSVPVGKIHVRLLFPKSTTPTIVYKNTKLQPIIKQSDLNDYTWEINNPVVMTTDGSLPSWYSAYASVQVSNLKNWNEVKDYCKTLLKETAYDKKGLKVIIDSIIKSSSDIEHQITSVVEFVQTHIRYSGNENGIYSHVPRTPDYVLKNRFGDCKEKSGLLNALLKMINIEAYPVLINTYMGTKLSEEVPSINAFDHCISGFYYQNKLYFIDPTISYQRGNFKLRILPAYELGMVLDNKENPFTLIPIDKSSKNDMLEEIVIDENGDARLKATCVYTGVFADDTRYYFLTNSIYDIQETYQNFYTKFSNEIEVLDTVKIIDEPEINKVTTIEYYLLKKLWSVEDSTESKSITKDFMPYALNGKLNYGNENTRKDPLKITFPYFHTHTITVTKAGGWNVETTVKEENNNYFNYSYTYKTHDDVLELIYSYNANTGVIYPSDYKDYKEKMDFINYNMLFTAQEKPLATGMISFNWPLLLTLLGAFLFAGILFWYLYKRPYITEFGVNHFEYSSISGWLILLGIGVTLNPLFLLSALYSEYSTEMGVNYAVYFFDAESSYFNPIRGYYAFFVAAVNTCLFVFSILVLVMFYQKKTQFRLYFLIFRGFNAVFIIVNLIVLYSFYGDSTDIAERQTLSKETTSMIKVVVQACIWIPYVWFSERSRYTFTIGNPVPEIVGSTIEVENPITNLEPDNSETAKEPGPSDDIV
jgi:transglutaminase-like putative cysteine protease